MEPRARSSATHAAPAELPPRTRLPCARGAHPPTSLRRARVRAANVLKPSLPPKKMGTSNVTVLTVQLAEAVSKASPSVNVLSSASDTVV